METVQEVRDKTQVDKESQQKALGCIIFLVLWALISVGIYRLVNDPREKDYPKPTTAEKNAYYELWGRYIRCRVALEKAQTQDQRNKLQLEIMQDEAKLQDYIRKYGLFLPYLPRKDKSEAMFRALGR
ncbi:MAG: hypothetical protein IKF77_02345, partial [Thermoguttaceae bacterium]|nr:hypothetical protein [Thermoguttaceae bacterium]